MDASAPHRGRDWDTAGRAARPQKQREAACRGRPKGGKDMATYREFRAQAARRRRKRALQRFLIFILAAALIFGLAWVIVRFIGPEEGLPDGLPGLPLSSSSGAASQPGAPSGSMDAGAQGASPSVLAPLPMQQVVDAGDMSWNTMGPVEQTVNAEITSPDYRMIALPENGVVDLSFFDTATFVGDSLTQGLELYTTGLPNAHYCAYKGTGPSAIVDGATLTNAAGVQQVALDALVESAPDTVYVLLGTNTLVNAGENAESSFIAYYGRMIEMMRERLDPRVRIYIQAIPPTRPEVAAGKPGLANDRIRRVNNQLAALALETGCGFVDLQEALADAEGNLNPEYAAKDGIHMNPTGYQAWVDYLCRHTIYDKRNPYLFGSPYYIEGA